MRTRQASAQETPTTSGANDDQEDFLITIKKIIKEEFDKHEKKIDEMVKLHLQSTNERLDKISKDVIVVTKSRMGKRRGSRPRTIICRFVRFKDKQKILQNAKKLNNTVMYIYEDFSKDTMELRKSLWEEVLNYRRQGNLLISITEVLS